MLKKSIYPKTKRVQGKDEFVITEKLDGSNLCIFKKEGKIYFAQRNNIFESSELNKDVAYKGLIGWVEENLSTLEESLNEGSVLCGEWIGMGKLSYPYLTSKFYMFAKANITEDFELKNIYYKRDLFQYCFKEQAVPEFIGFVPIVKVCDDKPSVQLLDEIYEMYIESLMDYYDDPVKVEGFVIENNNNIEKYVRMKNGTLEPHKSNYKGE